MATASRDETSRPYGSTRRGTVSALLAVAIAVPFLTSIVAAGLAVSQQRRLDRSTDELTRTFEIRRVARDVLTRLLDLESSQRGYVLTARGEYLETFEAARRGVPEALRHLTALVGTDPAQAARVSDLSQTAGARIALAAEIVAAVRRSDTDEARSLIDSGRGRQLTDQARTLVETMDRDEETRLLARQAELTAVSTAQARNLSALVAMSALALAVLILLVRRLLAYQGVVRMCPWSRTVEHDGEWLTFEEYLARRFGIQTTQGISPDAARRVREESSQKTQPTAS